MQTLTSRSKTCEAAALALLLLALLAPAAARAQLTPPPKWKDVRCVRMSRARAVFVGRVVGFERTTLKVGGREEPQRLVRFAVEERFKQVADKDKEVGVYTLPPEYSVRRCGRDFEVGGSYLVYINGTTKELRTEFCWGGGVPVAEAADDLAYLRALKRGEPVAEVAGRVEQLRHQYATNTLHLVGGLKGIEVTAELRGRTLKTKTDADGRYHFTGLVPGTYSLYINIPEGFYEIWASDTANTAAAPCYQTDFKLAPDGRIAGRATDPEGRPIAEAALELVPADTFPADESKIDEEVLRGSAVLTDADGRFEFHKVPAGRYLLGMNLRGVTEDVPFNIHPAGFFPRTYYPGTTARAEARVIELGEGGLVSGLALTLVPRPRRPLVLREIEGTVVFADGRPAPCAWIGQNAAKFAHWSPNSWSRVGEGGRFTVRGYEGYSYAVQVYVAVLDEQGRNTGLIHVRTAIISPAATTAPLRIALPPEVNCNPRRPPGD